MIEIKKTVFYVISLIMLCFFFNNSEISAQNQQTSPAIPGILMLLLEENADPVSYIFFDDFEDGNADGWVKVDDSEKPGEPSIWAVENGKYVQKASYNLNKWELSYPLGSFVYYNDSDSFNRSNYIAGGKLRSLAPISGLSEAIGMMVRYKDRNNYLRILISKSQGIVRLEKKVGGEFFTLAFNGRPPEMGSTIDLKVYVIDSQVFVYVNNEALFSAQDDDLASGGPLDSGTIALFTYSPAEFDNVMIGELDSVPRMIISEPMAYSVFSTDENSPPHDIIVSARAVNVPSGGGVQFILDSGTSYNDFMPPYSRTFSNVSVGERRVDARIINSSGQPIMHASAKDRDTNDNIGIGGKYLILFGDSISNGVGDDSNDPLIDTQNNSANGKNLNRGIAPALNDLISSKVTVPAVAVYNEGLGGTISSQGLERLQSTIDRHKKDQLDKIIWLILFGTNDSTWPILVPTFKSRMNDIISRIKAIGHIPILGKVPYVDGAHATRLELIQDYNTAIEELTAEHKLAATPPDFYNHFLNNTSELADDVHPNGIGYGSMAKMWFCALVISGIIPGDEPDYCTDYQY